MKQDFSKITQRRIALGMTQADLAGKIGVDKRTISRIETGVSAPSKFTAEKLSEVLFPGEPQRFIDLIAPPPDYSDLINDLDAARDIPGYFKPALRRLLSINDENGISFCLASISGAFCQFHSLNCELDVVVPAYCAALRSSMALSSYLDELESFWVSITAELGSLGEVAKNAREQMETLHRSPDFAAKLSAVKSAVSAAQAAFSDSQKRASSLSILRDASIILVGSRISEDDRLALFELLSSLIRSYQDAVLQALPG